MIKHSYRYNREYSRGHGGSIWRYMVPLGALLAMRFYQQLFMVVSLVVIVSEFRAGTDVSTQMRDEFQEFARL